MASSFLTLAREDEVDDIDNDKDDDASEQVQEELEWWSEAGSLAGLSLTSPFSLSRNEQLPHQGGREGFSLPPASSLSSLSYLQYPSPVSQPNPSKYPTGAASSSSTSTGTCTSSTSGTGTWSSSTSTNMCLKYS